MAEKRQKNEAYMKLDTEEVGFELEPAEVKVGSGYTVSISYEEDTQVIDVKTYGKVDIAKLRKDIQKIFPDAKIRNLNQVNTVTIAKRQKKKTITKK
ncbi:MAG: hypothetical protein ACP5IM_04030 [Candidatus Bathyarchaeia archaeon]|nr:MAG: hypothetical protein C0195_00780 [Candidatus Bathyarchaeota archaeon]